MQQLGTVVPQRLAATETDPSELQNNTYSPPLPQPPNELSSQGKQIRVNVLRSVAAALLTDSFGSLTILANVAQCRHVCVDTLASNPGYRSSSDTTKRVGGTASYAQNGAITIFAPDRAVFERVPSAVRNLFLPVEPKDEH